MEIGYIDQANERILRSISEVEGETVLGFLPLSENEVNQVLATVKAVLAGNSSKGLIGIGGLLQSAPGAAAYALAVAPSRTLLEGGKFFPALKEDLGLDIPSVDRGRLTAGFERACVRLGLLTGNLSGESWKNVKPFIFQAGILHYWKRPLSDGLRSTLRSHPAPDLLDDDAVGDFLDALRVRIHGQALLQRTLESPVGKLLIRRLVRAYVNDDDSELPAHLREPFREAFEGPARGIVLASPFLAFDPAFERLELVLPKLSGQVISTETRWHVESQTYRPTFEHRLPVEELGGGSKEFEVLVKNLSAEFADRVFRLSAQFDRSRPFRIFRVKAGLRELRTPEDRRIEVEPGEYWFMLAPGLTAGDDEEEAEEADDFRLLKHVDLRPGSESVAFSDGNRSWEIACALTAGFFFNRRDSVALVNGDQVHFGNDLSLVAYMPANREGDKPSVSDFAIECAAQEIDVSHVVEPDQAVSGALVFTERLDSYLSRELSRLPPGIHRVSLTLSTDSRRAGHSFWYWQGLESISDAAGFRCSAFPENIDLKKCRGVIRGPGGELLFDSRHHAPSVTVALSTPKVELIFPRAGVKATLIDVEQDWEEEVRADEVEIVTQHDRRAVRFSSGGFQSWSLRCGQTELATLDGRRRFHADSLAALCGKCGGSGTVVAFGAGGEKVRLLTFSKPLTASALQLKAEHGTREDVWTFQMPTEHLFELGLRMTDLSDRPNAKSSEVSAFLSKDDGFSESLYKPMEGIRVSSESLSDQRASMIRVRVTLSAELLQQRFLLLDFVRRCSADDSWLPIQCREKVGYSSLRIVFRGSGRSGGVVNAWKSMWSVRRFDERDPEPGLASVLETMSDVELARALVRCRLLSGWKYPGVAWAESSWMQQLSLILGRHRFDVSDGSATAWWTQGGIELAENTGAKQSAVVRQLLFSTQPSCLRTPPSCVKGCDEEPQSSATGRSLLLAGEIFAHKGLFSFVEQTFAFDYVDPLVYDAFEKWQAVAARKAEQFGHFDFRKFLDGLDNRTVELNEACARLEVLALLSAEHLLQAVRMLNRRCRLLADVADGDDRHPLAKVARSVGSMRRYLFRVASNILDGLKIGGQFAVRFTDNDFCKIWTPPCIENTWGRDVASAIWCLAATARLAANGRIHEQEFEKWLKTAFHTDQGGTLRENVGIVLNFAPELFAFYVALFDLALAE